MTRLALTVMAVWMILGLPGIAMTPAYEEALTFYYNGQYTLAEQRLQTLRHIPETPVLLSVVYLAQRKTQLAEDTLNLYQPDTEMQDYIKYLHFKIDIEKQNFEKIIEFAGDQSNFTNPYLLRQVLLETATNYTKNGDLAKGKEWALRLLQFSPDPITTPKTLRLLTVISLEKRNKTETIANYAQLLQRYPEEDISLELWNTISKVLELNMTVLDCFTTPSQAIPFLEQLYKTENYTQLDAMTSQYIQQFPVTKTTHRVYFLRGMANFYQGNYRESKRNIDIALLKKPEGFNDIEYTYFRAKTLMALKEKAVETALITLTSQKKQNPYRAWGYYWLCRYYQDNTNHTGYVATYAEFGKLFKNSPEYTQMEWEDNWKTLRKHIIARAPEPTIKDLFGALINNTSMAAKLTTFYAKNSKSWVEGVLHYPLYYSSYRQLDASLTNQDNLPESITAISAHADRLFQMGLGEIASNEILFIKETQPDRSQNQELRYYYGALVTKLKRYVSSSRIILADINIEPYQNLQKNIPSFLLKLFYPRPYWDTITSYSRQYNVDPYLVLAIMREESGFDPKAISRSGAIGLMQVMPKTGREIAFRLGHHNSTAANLYEPRHNIQMGTFYISWLRKQFKGPDFVAVAAYNAGPETTSAWVKAQPTTDLHEFVLRIPYSETSNYVRRVMNSYLMYKTLYNGE